MARLSATTLDLSRYPAPLAIRGIDFEGIVSARKQRLLALYGENDIAYNVQMLESDPGIILEEADAYRELLTLARVNDAVRAVMVAFATGSDLDHLGAFYGVQRRVIVPATDTTAAVYENDAEFRRYVLLAPEAWAAAGPIGAYVFHAGQADAEVLNADVWTVHGSGVVNVAIQSRVGDGLASDELVERVAAHLNRNDIKPLTDHVVVRSVVNVPYAIDVQCFVLPGPDPMMAKQEVQASLAAMAAARRTPSRDVPRSAVYAAASVGAVDHVLVAEPVADIARGHGEVAVCTGIEVTVSTHDG
jgi:phage-related baseplate assembly protein